MKSTLSSLILGLVFGVGLLLSGMANPAKVIGFLDLAGAWDPSLILVMIGAIAVGVVAFSIAGKRSKSLLGDKMKLPSSGRIDKRLVFGSLIFGAGWGLAGFCPGPGLVAFGAGEVKATVFVLAMAIGMGLYEYIERARARASRA